MGEKCLSMWTVAAVNKKFNGPLGSYNALTDVHLAHFFSEPSHQAHLKSANLVTNNGIIIPENKVKVATLQYEKKKKIYDMLANTVIQNAAHKEGSWNKKLCSYLEDVSKMENVEKIKRCFSAKERSHYSLPLSFNDSCPHFENSLHQIIYSHKNKKRKNKKTSKDAEQRNQIPIANMSLKMPKRCFSAKGTSPYTVPLSFNGCYPFSQSSLFSTICSQKKGRHKKIHTDVEQRNQKSISRMSLKIAKLSISDQKFYIDQCRVTLYYHGHTPLVHSQTSISEDVLIKQQHCGGASLIVYRGAITPNETLTFESFSHDGYTFSITLFLDGIRYLKLSSCCVFRYSPGRRLGGSSGSFSILSVNGGKPCIKCQFREIETSDKVRDQKLISVNKLKSQEMDYSSARPSNFIQKNNSSVAEYNNLQMKNYNETHINTEEIESSVESEIINSAEENEENLEVVFDNHDTDIHNEVFEDELEDANDISVEENFSDAKERSNDSSSSIASIAESVKNFVTPSEYQVKSYEIGSSSSDDDGGGKQLIILASVHGSPTSGP